MGRRWLDIESGELITEQQLMDEFEELVKRDAGFENGHRGITFEEYALNCLTINNGALERLV